MRNIGIVFNFEFKNIIQKKTFKITTLILSLIVFAAVLIPAYLVNRKNETAESGTSIVDEFFPEETNDKDSDKTTGFNADIGIVADQELLADIAAYTDAFSQTQKYQTEEDLTAAVKNEEIKNGIVLLSPQEFLLITNGDKTTALSDKVEQNLQYYTRIKNLEKAGLSVEQINRDYDRIYADQIIGSVRNLNVRDQGNFIFGTVYTIFAYMMISLYGSTVSASVAREKDNRTMEVLIANTKPDYLIVGKTLAAGLAGIIQIFILICSFFVALKIAGIPLSMLSQMVSIDVDVLTIVVILFFGLTGYIFYLFIYAALGAMVSKIEDVNYAVTPVTLLFVAAYFITFMGMNMPNNIVFKIGSFIPFIAVLAMPVRYLINFVPTIELVISALIMLFSIIIFSRLAIRIYRLGSLNYGNRMKFFNTLKLIFKGEDK